MPTKKTQNLLNAPLLSSVPSILNLSVLTNRGGGFLLRHHNSLHLDRSRLRALNPSTLRITSFAPLIPQQHATQRFILSFAFSCFSCILLSFSCFFFSTEQFPGSHSTASSPHSLDNLGDTTVSNCSFFQGTCSTFRCIFFQDCITLTKQTIYISTAYTTIQIL